MGTAGAGPPVGRCWGSRGARGGLCPSPRHWALPCGTAVPSPAAASPGSSPHLPRSPDSPSGEVAPGTPCAGDAFCARTLRLRQACWGGGLCRGAVPPVRVGCVAGAVCRASARVRGRLGAVTVQRCLRGEGWHSLGWGGAGPSRPSPRRLISECRRSVCPSIHPSLRRGGPAAAIDVPSPLAVARGDWKGTA